MKLVFYKRYVDDIYNRCKKNCTGIELPPNIEINPKKFLGTLSYDEKWNNRNCYLLKKYKTARAVVIEYT